MMPAHALAEELLPRGHRVALITDDRGARIPACSKACRSMSCRPGGSGGGPLGWLQGGARECSPGGAMALALYETSRPPR